MHKDNICHAEYIIVTFCINQQGYLLQGWLQTSRATHKASWQVHKFCGVVDMHMKKLAPEIDIPVLLMPRGSPPPSGILLSRI